MHASDQVSCGRDDAIHLPNVYPAFASNCTSSPRRHGGHCDDIFQQPHRFGVFWDAHPLFADLYHPARQVTRQVTRHVVATCCGASGVIPQGGTRQQSRLQRRWRTYPLAESSVSIGVLGAGQDEQSIADHGGESFQVATLCLRAVIPVIVVEDDVCGGDSSA
jgi:hypothetical protein